MNRLKITVEKIDGYCNLPMLVGDSFMIDGGRILIPDGKYICMWALQSMMPIFPLLQRVEPEEGDWTGKAGQVFTCPDPKGLVHYRIERMPEGKDGGK
ncbi:MAG: TIGR04076 family protein [Desulfobacterales bacterium]|nr:TIGR04076 family protein [Desulfobacterales bacterium]